MSHAYATCPLGHNFFEHLWNHDPKLSIEDRIRDHAAKLAYVLAKDEAATARIPHAVKRLKIIMAYNCPTRTKIYLWSFFLRRPAHECSRRFFRLIHNLFKRPRRIGLWSVLLLLHPIWTAAFVFGSTAWNRKLMNQIYKKKEVGGIYLQGERSILIFQPALGRGLFSHEIMHWLKDQGLILSDQPLASIMDKLYKETAHELDNYCTNDAAPFSFRWVGKHIDRLIDQEVYQSAKDRRAHLVAKTEDTWHYSESDIFHHLSLRGMNAVMRLEAIEALLKGAADEEPLSDRWYLFMPTVIFMRCQLFANRDFFFMDKRGNPEELRFIYHFGLLVTKVSHRCDQQEAAKTRCIKRCAHSLLQSYRNIPAIDRQKIEIFVETWIERISSREFNQYEKRLADKCSCMRISTGQCPEKPLMKLSWMAKYGISNKKRVSLPLIEETGSDNHF